MATAPLAVLEDAAVAGIDAAADLDALAALWRSVPDNLARLRDNGMPARQVSAVHTALIEAMLGRVIALRGDPVLAAVDHSWLFLGSLARREPLAGSDLDTALVWAEPPEAVSADEIRAAAGQVLDDLVHCGLRPCPKGVRADNPLFSRSRADWAAAVWSWQRDPTGAGALLLSAMIADSRPVTGVDLGLGVAAELRAHARTSQYLRLLLDEAMHWRPSAGTLRPFRIDHIGGHRGEMDLKAGGLVPIIALGRWIAIVTGDAGGSTVERLSRGVAAGLLTEDEGRTLCAGFDELFTVLYDRELAAVRAGAEPSTYVRPRDLDPPTRRHLPQTLRAIGAVQRRVDEFWLRRLEKE